MGQDQVIHCSNCTPGNRIGAGRDEGLMGARIASRPQEIIGNNLVLEKLSQADVKDGLSCLNRLNHVQLRVGKGADRLGIAVIAFDIKHNDSPLAQDRKPAGVSDLTIAACANRMEALSVAHVFLSAKSANNSCIECAVKPLNKELNIPPHLASSLHLGLPTAALLRMGDTCIFVGPRKLSIEPGQPPAKLNIDLLATILERQFSIPKGELKKSL